MDRPRIATREEWRAERLALLARERELTRALDALRAERRALPWVRVEREYRFAAPGGEVALRDLFDGRSQLAVYHFMLPPEGDHICDGCAFVADHVDAARAHFEQADLSFAAVSRAPLARIEAVRRRFGWRFAWVSAGDGPFPHDYGVHFTPEEITAGTPLYNYGTTPYLAADLHGVSIFARDAAGDVFHTYSTFARGPELLLGAFNWLDLAPKGRNERGTMSWVRLRDEYAHPAAGCCHAAE
jgi:predicted dithiol-disulfide oxidoreductase (DUF899 family)